MTPHDGPPLSTPKKLEEEKGGLPRLLLGRFGRTIGLIVGVSRSEGRMVAGTCSIGLISRNSLECCSPPLFTKLTGFISYGISFRFNAINEYQKHLNLYTLEMYLKNKLSTIAIKLILSMK
ncbi:hypothetical protein ALC56_11586 [Trachymyrmex septentrionalis]|uniref:Uncharacterized protein n=1 Tax=Trachymyrmex septentrionalis TaxID=34720 RepID=A0A195F124_9HYME|nr:hypothetical protein ALC56_11586 [Trachymyrmex septentrionalis]